MQTTLARPGYDECVVLKKHNDVHTKEIIVNQQKIDIVCQYAFSGWKPTLQLTTSLGHPQKVNAKTANSS